MIKDNYLYSAVYKKVDDFTPENGSTYVYGHSTEQRSYIVEELRIRMTLNIQFVEIREVSHDIIQDLNSQLEYSLRDSESMKSFLQRYSGTQLYIDSSGLNNRICASLINNTFTHFHSLNFKDLKIIYAEPNSYRIYQFTTEGFFNDLSERIDGIEPLPGFSSIIPYDGGDTYLVALLGFEGGRFKYILENVQPSEGTVFPVIGVPGFRVEYPFVAYWGNRRPLDDKDIWCNINYIAANSIVEVYNLLGQLLKNSPSGRLKIAPIGTKPHAIGAILFAIKHPNKVELVYDNPKREKKRTDGIGKIIECSAYKLLIEK